MKHPKRGGVALIAALALALGVIACGSGQPVPAVTVTEPAIATPVATPTLTNDEFHVAEWAQAHLPAMRSVLNDEEASIDHGLNFQFSSAAGHITRYTDNLVASWKSWNRFDLVGGRVTTLEAYINRTLRGLRTSGLVIANALSLSNVSDSDMVRAANGMRQAKDGIVHIQAQLDNLATQVY